MPASSNFVLSKGKNAGEALTKKRFVKLDPAASDGEAVVMCDTAGERAYGVSKFSVSTAEIAKGKGASVEVEGRSIVEASEAIAVGDPIATTNDGRAAVADTAGWWVIGVCDEPAAGAGDECSVLLTPGGGKF